MRSKIGVFIFAVISVAILFASQPAMAGCSVTAWDSFADALGADKKAAGTKLTGPLTFVLGEGDVDSSFYLRLRKGMEIYQFDGECDDSLFGIEEIEDYVEQGECIDHYFNHTVIPYIFECKSIVVGGQNWGVEDCPSDDQVVLKSIDMGTEQGSVGNYYIIDITVAVQD